MLYFDSEGAVKAAASKTVAITKAAAAKTVAVTKAAAAEAGTRGAMKDKERRGLAPAPRLSHTL